MLLHTITASPRNPAFEDCCRVMRADDAVVLMGDAVYAALPGSKSLTTLMSRTQNIYALDTDVALAGTDVARQVTVIDMNSVVELTERYTKQLPWY